jgi:hypothetical protein
MQSKFPLLTSSKFLIAWYRFVFEFCYPIFLFNFLKLLQLRNVIDEKQKWAQDLRIHVQEIKVKRGMIDSIFQFSFPSDFWLLLEKAHADVEKAAFLSEEQKAYTEAVVEKLAGTWRLFSTIALMNVLIQILLKEAKKSLLEIVRP